jgi:large conductance mechanosensitive channel protein
MLQGFKEFIMKGNVVDLAVAVVIGGAFATVVDALVNSVLMPLISVLVGTPNFDNFLAVGPGPEHAIKIGVLLTAVVNFLLVAAAIYFVVVMPMNKIIERRNARMGITPEEEPIDPQVLLLTEIRDSLQTRN